MSHSFLLLAMQDMAVTACQALHNLVLGSLIISGPSERGAPKQERTKSDSVHCEGHPTACSGWWRYAGGSWDDMKLVRLLFSLLFHGEMTGSGYQVCFDGSSWSLLLPGMVWLAGLATTHSKSILHLTYLSSPTCLLLSHLSLPFPSTFHSKICGPRELSMCTRQAQVTCVKGFSPSMVLVSTGRKTGHLQRPVLAPLLLGFTGHWGCPEKSRSSQCAEHWLGLFGIKPAGKYCLLSRQFDIFSQYGSAT